MRLERLPIALVYPNPHQPRTIFDQAELEELGASIEEHGLLEPIQVRQDADGRYLIVCGERRYRAHLIIGANDILATIADVSDDELAERAIVENLQRKDITPLEEAIAFQARIDETGMSPAELSKRLGLKNDRRVAERLSLLKLTPEMREAYAKGILIHRQALLMSTLSPANQKALFEAIARGRVKNYHELCATVQALKMREAQVSMFSEAQAPSPKDEDVEAVRRLEAKIERVCGIIRDGFDGNEAIIARKVSSLKADVMAEQLELMEKQLKTLRLALRAGAAVRAA